MTIYDAGRGACVEFLIEPTARHERQIARLEARTERLEDRLRENSSDSSQPPPPSEDPVDLLKRLSELRDAGVLSDEEFRAKKTELLGRM